MYGRSISGTVKRVEDLVRLMYAHKHPGKKLEIDREMLELDVMKHAAIKLALTENLDEEGGVK